MNHEISIRPHLFAATLRFGIAADAKAFGAFIEKWYGIEVADPPLFPSHRVLFWESSGDGFLTLQIQDTSVRGARRYVGEFLSVTLADWQIVEEFVLEPEAVLVGIVRAEVEAHTDA